MPAPQYQSRTKEYRTLYARYWYNIQKNDPLRKEALNIAERITQKKKYIRILQDRIEMYDQIISSLSLKLENIRKNIKREARKEFNIDEQRKISSTRKTAQKNNEKS